MAGGVKEDLAPAIALSFAALLLLSAAMVLPAAYGQQSSSPSSPSASSLAVTTNKSVYDSNDRVIIAGTIDLSGSNNNDDDNNNKANFVTVQVAKDDDDAAGTTCGQQSIRVDRDGSFFSRSMKMSCGPGNYTVTATYGAQMATARFRIADDEETTTAAAAAQGNDLAQIRDAVVQARDGASARIKELVQANITVLPAQAVEKYQLGSSEASLAIQLAEYGDAQDARKHMDVALAYFAAVQDLLSPENMQALSRQTATTGSSGDDNNVEEMRLAAVDDRYDRLADIYPALVALAQKNGVSDTIFDDIQSLLVEAKRLIDMADLGSAESTLTVTELVVDKARAKLVDHADGRSDNGAVDNSGSNNNNNDDDNNSTTAGRSPDARSLSASADRLEKRAERQLAEAGDNVQAQEQIRAAMNLIGAAKSAIAAGDYPSARESLFAASNTLINADRLTRG